MGQCHEGAPRQYKATTNLVDLVEWPMANGLLSNSSKGEFWPCLSDLSRWKWRTKKRVGGGGRVSAEGHAIDCFTLRAGPRQPQPQIISLTSS